MTDRSDFVSAVQKMREMGPARDRTTDRETRTLTITDDEALAVLAVLQGKGLI